MALPQAAVLVVVAAGLWLFYWRDNPATYTPPEPQRPGHPRTLWAAAVLCLIFVGGVLAGFGITVVSVVAAAGLIAAHVAWDRAGLAWSLVPWRLPIFVTGLFLVMDTLVRHGLGSVMSGLIGTDAGAIGMTRAAGTGALLSNALNNLPVYVAGEAVIPAANHAQLIAFLIGTNVGAIVTPWAALATLLWAGRCRAAGLEIPWRRFVATGAVTVVVALAAGVGGLILS